MMLDVLADPYSFGFENIIEPVLLYGNDPDVSLWWDLAHFTLRFQHLMQTKLSPKSIIMEVDYGAKWTGTIRAK